MKEKFINLFNDKFDKIKIKDICNIDSKPSKVNTIMIQRNSNAVGTVSLSTEDSIETTNIYYLNNIKKDFNEKCLYHILKNNEEQFFKLANLTSTVNLNRTNLENFEIQIYTEDVQEKIVTQCDLYDRICNDLSEMNSTIMIKNIVNEITKLEKDIVNKQNKLPIV
jgi:restriction endonuclease S subunit